MSTKFNKQNDLIILTPSANQFIQEKKYWERQLDGLLTKSMFLHDKNVPKDKPDFKEINIDITEIICKNLFKLSNSSDIKLYVILTTNLFVLINKYFGLKDILIGTSIFKHEKQLEVFNKVLLLRSIFEPQNSFKELLLKVKQTILDADLNRNWSVLNNKNDLKSFNGTTENTKLFDIAICLENIQYSGVFEDDKPSVLFHFKRDENTISGIIEYDSNLYIESTIISIAGHYVELLKNLLENIEEPISNIEMLTSNEKKYLIEYLNNNRLDFPREQTIHSLIEEQVKKTPGNIAVFDDDNELSYQDLNIKANQLARELSFRGVSKGDVVCVMMNRSIDVVVSILAVLKLGATYLPIDIDLPHVRINHMIDDSGSKYIITNIKELEHFSFSFLLNFKNNTEIKIIKTPSRSHIKEFNELPIPDRSLINLTNYRNKIGMASVTNCMSIQTTRGCPYNCLFCHKIWSKHHVHRSGQNIFDEISYYYKKGVRNFAVIDDCFNLNIHESSLFFQKIIKSKLDIQLFFPNGLRGDIMTPDYINLMIEAGTRGINLSLETASPRLQKLLKKNLDLDKFKKVVDFIASSHPEIILEMATMHGFPTETEEEAMMTLNFIKDIKWLHFPYIHILKIFPNTEMEEFALNNGVRKSDILLSKDRAFHELPETLPFSKGFTRKYQADFMNEYFLNKDRLNKVLPIQMKILSETAMIQKYNAYLPVEIKSIQDITEFAGLNKSLLDLSLRYEEKDAPIIFDETANNSVVENSKTKKILFLDLSQYFSSHSMLYKVVEQPIGLMYLLTYVKKKFGEKIDGRIIKSGVDFDNYNELQNIIQDYQPDLICIRTLSFYQEFFHKTVSIIRNWGIDIPIILGGPYASSEYDTILKDTNVNLVILGEGEYTFEELLNEMFKNDFKIPDNNILQKIEGIAYREISENLNSRNLIILDSIKEQLNKHPSENLNVKGNSNDLAYIMYTSGSTGLPKGVMVEHRQVNNCLFWMDKEFGMSESDVMAQRTNLTFDPSVFEIFWPLYKGAKVYFINSQRSKDAHYLVKLLSSNHKITKMYCTASMFTAMTHILDSNDKDIKIKLPLLFIGAEPVTMKVVKNFHNYLEGKVVNTYGPTEGTINNTFYWLDKDDPKDIVPIGKSVANNQVFILSSDLQHRPVGYFGEICIAGESVTRGYINNKLKTDEVFITNPFGKGRLYKTGDIGRRLPDGNIQIKGRIDEQIKIRGYRIELGEIRSALLNHDDIQDCLIVVRAANDDKLDLQYCKKCGISSAYPEISIDESSICSECNLMENHKKIFQKYFKTLDDLVKLIKENNIEQESKYDCILLYSGGRGAGYALYQLVQRGIKVLTLTYNNGYFSPAEIRDIKYITSSLGVDNVILKHDFSDSILKESMKSFSTVCRGCFHTSSSLAAEYAYKNNIKVVIGATLSRGQIIENKLKTFIKDENYDIQSIEKQILNMQKSTPLIDKKIFNLIGINEVSDGRIHEKIKFVDFYRFCDINNEDLISFLNNRDSHWKKKKNYSIYSTNCSIKGIGDYGFNKDHGIHYYGAATSWENRLGHLTLDNLRTDLNCKVTETAYSNFLKRLGVLSKVKISESEQYICAYYILKNKYEDNELSSNVLREFLLKLLPEYMVPSYFVEISSIPLTINGKIDTKSLPSPQKDRVITGTSYVAPNSEMEKSIERIWKDILKLDKIGINDNFFDLGGSSLSLILCNSKINDLIKREIPITTLFTHTTIKSLAEHLSNGANTLKNDEESNQLFKTLEEGKDLMKNKFS